MIGALILQAVLIAVNALFASSEIAVISMSEGRLKMLADEGDKRAKKLLTLTKQPSKFLATIQVAITLAGLMGGAFAAENFADPIVDLILSLGASVPRQALHSAVVVLITLVLTYFSIVFGELVPKRLAMKKTESLSLSLAGILYFMSKICAPLVWLLTVSTNALLRMLGIDPNQNEEIVTEDEIKMKLMEGAQQGTIETDENEIIQNVFDMNDTSAEEVSTRRRDVVCLYLEDDMSVWADTIRNSHYTYFPVCGESQDDVVGVLNTKDYFRLDDLSRKSVMKNAVDKPFFVPEGIRADQLFSRMKQERKYFAIVIDEYGGMSGIVTVHDLMEELVGNMDDEDTVREVEIRQLNGDRWEIRGSADLEEVAEKLGVQLPTDEHETFNGLVCGIVGRVPDEGEQFSCEGYGLKIDVKNVTGHRVDTALVEKTRKPFDDAAEEKDK